MRKKKSDVRVKKRKKMLGHSIATYTMSKVRKVMEDRIAELGMSKRQFSKEAKVTTATVYNFFNKGTALGFDIIERMFDVLKLEVKPKERR